MPGCKRSSTIWRRKGNPMAECEIGNESCLDSSVILVVDDQAANIQTVGAHLSGAGFDVMPALSGEQAMQRIGARLPDLILLDLLMPGMDGFEVLAQLRKDPATAPLPVIVLTAMHDRALLVKAFDAGAVDYVTKPFVVEELLARVRTHLELKRTRDHLSRIAKEQAELTQIVAHDLKSPLSNIQFSTQMLQQQRQLPPERSERLLKMIDASTQEALKFIQSYLGRWADGELKRRHNTQTLMLAPLLERAIERMIDPAAARGMRIHLDAGSDPLAVAADETAVMNVLQNLLSNAVRYSRPDTELEVQQCPGTPGFMRIRVLDRGPGISEDDQKKLFRRYARLSAPASENSSGLGLAIAKQEIAQMGGHLWFEPRAGGGSVFAFELPASLS